MKRKIGELRNVPIVEGDKNLVREGTEIHINDLQSKGSSSSGSSSKYAPRYFSIDFEKANVDWQKLMIISSELLPFKMAASYKYFSSNEPIISANGYPETNNLTTYSFSYIPLCVNSEFINVFELNNIQEGFKSLEEVIHIINIIAPKVSFSINLSMEGITEITEEEYYKID